MPAVKGGAVENLIEIYLKRNEVDPHANYTVFSTADLDAQEEANRYHHSHFEYINSETRKGLAYYNRKRNKFWRKYHLQLPYYGDPFIRAVVDRIKTSGIHYDCIIIENAPIYSIYVKKKLKVPVVQHVHNDEIAPSIYGADKIVRTSDRIWAVSNFIKNRIALVPALAKSSCKVTVLYNGIDTERFSKSISLHEKEELKAKLNIKKTDKILLYVGRIDPHKGVKELLQAFKKLSGDEDLKLLIVGSSFFSMANKTAYICELEELSQGNGLENKIRFTGYVDYAQVHKYYQLADIAVIPSIWDDPFPLTCLEALAAGCALIVSDSGGMVEAVDKKSAMTVVRNADFVEQLSQNIELLLADTSRQEEMKKAAIQRAQLFTAEIYYQNYLKLLSDVIG